jgi:hypothetical protein
MRVEIPLVVRYFGCVTAALLRSVEVLNVYKRETDFVGSN